MLLDPNLNLWWVVGIVYVGAMLTVAVLLDLLDKLFYVTNKLVPDSWTKIPMIKSRFLLSLLWPVLGVILILTYLDNELSRVPK